MQGICVRVNCLAVVKYARKFSFDAQPSNICQHVFSNAEQYRRAALMVWGWRHFSGPYGYGYLLSDAQRQCVAAPEADIDNTVE